MTHYHIEVAHVYADETFGDEHRKGLAYARNFIEGVGAENVSVSVVVDDIHVAPERRTLDINSFVESCAMEGVIIDHVMFEGDYLTMADSLHISLEARVDLKAETFDRGHRVQIGFTSEGRFVGIRENNKPTCSLLSAAMIYSRLNPRDDSLPPSFNYTQRPTTGDRLLTILPHRFMRVEDNVTIILEKLRNKSLLSKSDYIFFN